jgi:hypothetical protein
VKKYIELRIKALPDVVINLGSGTTSHAGTSNVKVTITDEGERSSLLFTYNWNETMMDANQMYAGVKENEKDGNLWLRSIAHRLFLADNFGLPGDLKMKSTVRIPLPIKVRDVNTKINALKDDSNGSRLLIISMESAKDFKQVKLWGRQHEDIA